MLWSFKSWAKKAIIFPWCLTSSHWVGDPFHQTASRVIKYLVLWDPFINTKTTYAPVLSLVKFYRDNIFSIEKNTSTKTFLLFCMYYWVQYLFRPLESRDIGIPRQSALLVVSMETIHVSNTKRRDRGTFYLSPDLWVEHFIVLLTETATSHYTNVKYYHCYSWNRNIPK